MLIINDDEFIEGIIGGFAFLIILWIFRGYLRLNWLERAGIIFPLTWVIRKIGMNLYKTYKKNMEINDIKINF